ncbi:MAG TPA: DUF1579 domain-containing protein [Candidatus Krumholzibacteria bacterium]|nr:DUF1579 domain-containing protein [Candidatus Krumholzibacteria bacterium]
MTKRLAVALAVLLAAAACFAQSAEPDPAAVQEAWLKAGTPGPFQAFLADKTGTWTVAGKSWSAPGAEPELSESTTTAEMILGGRVLSETMRGTNMGMPFEGMGLTAYDNATGTVTSTWSDNMSTGIMVLTGAWAKPGDPLVLTGTMHDPFSGADMPVRTVTTFISHDEQLFEFFVAGEGMGEMKMMELRYTRQP